MSRRIAARRPSPRVAFAATWLIAQLALSSAVSLRGSLFEKELPAHQDEPEQTPLPAISEDSSEEDNVERVSKPPSQSSEGLAEEDIPDDDEEEEEEEEEIQDDDTEEEQKEEEHQAVITQQEQEKMRLEECNSLADLHVTWFVVCKKNELRTLYDRREAELKVADEIARKVFEARDGAVEFDQAFQKWNGKPGSGLTFLGLTFLEEPKNLSFTKIAFDNLMPVTRHVKGFFGTQIVTAGQRPTKPPVNKKETVFETDSEDGVDFDGFTESSDDDDWDSDDSDQRNLPVRTLRRANAQFFRRAAGVVPVRTLKFDVPQVLG